MPSKLIKISIIRINYVFIAFLLDPILRKRFCFCLFTSEAANWHLWFPIYSLMLKANYLPLFWTEMAFFLELVIPRMLCLRNVSRFPLVTRSQRTLISGRLSPKMNGCWSSVEDRRWFFTIYSTAYRLSLLVLVAFSVNPKRIVNSLNG